MKTTNNIQTFRTIVEVPNSPNKISYKDKVMFIGSCFTENIGQYFSDYLFDVNINPFGILYNPISIQNSLEILLNKTIFTSDNLKHHNNLWFSFYHHSKFSHSDKETCLENINNQINFSSNFLSKTNFLFITFGTSWIYQLNKKEPSRSLVATDNMIVSNCHKLPAKKFIRKLLTVKQIFENFENLVKRIKLLNPNIQIVFTVSPIRHLKDGAVANQLSKSTLIVAINQLINQFDNVSYFPSYEIMLDDLRDYRFYKSDMTHISETATDYIWNKFSEAYFSAQTLELIKEILRINKALNHKPTNLNSKAHLDFIKKNIEKLENIKKINTFVKIERLLSELQIINY